MEKKSPRKWKIILLVIALWFTVHTLITVVDGLTDEIAPADVAVVLGSQVFPDGSPSPRLCARLDRAAELHRKGLVGWVLVSGATGKEGWNEAEVMRDYLIVRGIPSDRILTDPQGNTTQATVYQTQKIMRDKGLESLCVVSQYFHIPRCKLAFRKQGLKQVYSAHAYYFEWRDLYSLAREFFAYYGYLLRKTSPAN